MYTVYSKNNCPGCSFVKSKLMQKDIEYVEINIDTSQRDKEWLIEQGYRSVPVVFLNGKEVDIKTL